MTDPDPTPKPMLIARYPGGDWSFALWEHPGLTPEAVEAKRVEAEARGCVLYREHHVPGECRLWKPSDPPGERIQPPTHPLAREIAHYRAIKDDLLAAGYEGLRVVVGFDNPEHAPITLGPFAGLDEAMEAAYGRFGLGGFLVKEVDRVERVHVITRMFC